MHKHSLNTLNKAITHRAVRDLAWALLQPAFFTSLPNTQNDCLDTCWLDDELIDWLYALDKKPALLFDHLKDQRATRLGIYFEQLLSFYFAEYPRFTLKAKNLQANATKRTIGEYDFIVWDQQEQQHYHIEVAVKFYIGLSEQQFEQTRPIKNNIVMYNWHQWVGPNKKDTLSIKMKHLLQHQLCLSDTEAGANALANIGLNPCDLKHKLLLTGRLYLPSNLVEQPPKNIDKPQHIHHTPESLAHWFNLTELQNILSDNKHESSVSFSRNSRYAILPRQYWMADMTQTDIDNDDEVTVFEREELITYITDLFGKDDTPLHIAEIGVPDILSAESTDNAIEKQRFFVIA